MPRPAVGRVAELARSMPPGARVLDVAAGTGILTGQLSRLGHLVIAVESLGEMVGHLRRAVPGAPAVQGVPEALPVADRSVGLCTVAQRVRWFDERAALAEIRRVLEPGAPLVWIWNERDESEPWVAALRELVEQHTGGRPDDDHRDRPWVEVVDGTGGFTPLESTSYPYPMPVDVEGVLDRLRSASAVAALPRESADRLLVDARAVLIDGFGLTGTFSYPHHTMLHICRALA